MRSVETGRQIAQMVRDPGPSPAFVPLCNLAPAPGGSYGALCAGNFLVNLNVPCSSL